jgi:DNA-binding transcriptional regulator PaaX
MLPIDRFKKTNTEGNLWVYILSLAKDEEVASDTLPELIFEKFGFLPSRMLCALVMLRLKRDGYITGERKAGKKAYKTSQKGINELGKMRIFCQNLLEKI